MARRLLDRSAAQLGFALVLAVGLVVVPASGTTAPSSTASQARAETASSSAALGPLASLPVQAQSVISAALGSNRAANAAQRSAGGYRLEGGGVTAMFSRGRLKVRAGGETVSMRLAGIGRGSRTVPLGPAVPTGHGNRVSYVHSGVKEWYAAGPLGIEQGFTVSRRPAGPSAPLTLELGLGGTLETKQAGSQLRFVGASGETALRFGALVALDANRHRLPASLVLDGRSLRLQVDDTGARYPLLIDPLIQQGPKLTGSGEIGTGLFGQSVALSADGNTALVGGPFDNSLAGAAWVFTRTGGVWTQQGAKLTPNDESGGGIFGFDVALSADGNTALIGGYLDNGLVGAAWVFTRTAGVWTQQGAKLTGSGATGPSGFGSSVALSADGNSAVIGGYFDNSGVGAGWVFTRIAGVWTQQGAKLTANDEVGNANFGISVAVSPDGNTALFGGPSDDRSLSNNIPVGAAWVFVRAAGVWTQQGAKLIGGGATSPSGFGTSVASSADGNTALVGGPSDSGGVGAAWVFTRSAGVWTQQGAKLTANDETGLGQFGNANGLALTADGNTAVIAGPGDSSFVGAAWVFTRSAGVWTQQGAKLTGSGETGPGQFGNSVASSSDASTVLIGGTGDNGDVGAAWVFVATPCANPTITGTPGSDVIVGSPAADVITGLGGNDFIAGLGGNDVICGGLGNDYLDGGDGLDTIYGDDGTGAPAASGDNDVIQGGGGADNLYGEGGLDIVAGGPGVDSFDGGAGADVMSGGDGNDVMYGGLGADTLAGAAGNDSVNGDLQPTQTAGGPPGVDPTAGVVDICSGGAGTDTTNGSCETKIGIP
jgi:Ca2+-binding RTX toxin-like protein